MNRLNVFIVMLDHELELYQHPLGVFPDMLQAFEVQKLTDTPTSIYETYLEYDEYPEDGEFIVIEVRTLEDRTAALRATNTSNNYKKILTSFFNPETDLVNEYLKCIIQSSSNFSAFLEDTTGEVTFMGTSAAFIEKEVVESDISDEDKLLLIELLADVEL